MIEQPHFCMLIQKTQNLKEARSVGTNMVMAALLTTIPLGGKNHKCPLINVLGERRHIHETVSTELYKEKSLSHTTLWMTFEDVTQGE